MPVKTLTRINKVMQVHKFISFIKFCEAKVLIFC